MQPSKITRQSASGKFSEIPVQGGGTRTTRRDTSIARRVNDDVTPTMTVETSTATKEDEPS
jgi:hypothetical protein